MADVLACPDCLAPVRRLGMDRVRRIDGARGSMEGGFRLDLDVWAVSLATEAGLALGLLHETILAE